MLHFLQLKLHGSWERRGLVIVSPRSGRYSAIETKLIWLKNNVAAGKLDCAVSSSWGRGEGLRSSTGAQMA